MIFLLFINLHLLSDSYVLSEAPNLGNPRSSRGSDRVSSFLETTTKI